MKILTFDTSLNTMYVTLSDDGKILMSKIVESSKEKYHSAYIIPTIIELLHSHNLTMQDINAIGVNIGPGSFTGIRAGVTVARVVGQSLNIPVVGIPSLEVISGINKTEKQTLCLLDARKNKAYAAIYNKGNTEFEPQAVELEKALELAKKDFFIISDSKMNKLLKAEEIESVIYEECKDDLGIYLASITYNKLNNNKKAEFAWHHCKPLYIQPPPISMPKKIKA